MRLSLALSLLLCHSWVLGDEDQRLYDLGDFPLEVGVTLPATKISYTCLLYTSDAADE